MIKTASVAAKYRCWRSFCIREPQHPSPNALVLPYERFQPHHRGEPQADERPTVLLLFTRTAPLVGAAIVLCSAVGSAMGQVVIDRARDDVPAIARVLPVALAPGQRAQVEIAGERLEGLHAILAPAGVGLVRVISVEAKAARLELEVASDAAPGEFAFHVLAAAGLSNPRLLRVSPGPQQLETEENNMREQANALQVPGGMSGTLTAEDRDWFRFEAAARQQIVFEAAAPRIGSPLSPVITLFDEAGRELARSLVRSSGLTPDARLVYRFEQAGAYYVRLHDLAYQGAEHAVYHLRAGDVPYATAMFPLGGRRGTRVELMLSGGSLAEPLVHAFDLPADAAWVRRRFNLPHGGAWLAAPAWFAAGDLPELAAIEPNNLPGEAQRIEPPIVVNGRLERPGDRDTFVFRATAGSRLLLRLTAQQLGSPLDGVLTLFDPQGNELAVIDDRDPLPREGPVVRLLQPLPQVDDPQFDFTVPSDGDYTLTVEDRNLSGGAAYAYRLQVAPPPVDFELLVQPTVGQPVPGQPQQQQPAQQVLTAYDGAGTGALTLDRGGSGSLSVRAIRDGYAGAIALTVVDLPSGVEAAPALIPAGQNDAVVNLVADFDAPSTARFCRVLGHAVEAPQPLVREAVHPVFFSVLPVNGATAQELGVVAVGVSQRGAELAVRGRAEGLAPQGGMLRLAIEVRRREGLAGDVRVELLYPPAGLATTDLTLPADQQHTQLELPVQLDAAAGRHTILLQATLAVEGREQPILAVYPVPFEIVPAVTLELAGQQLDLPVGAQASLLVHVRRAGTERGPVELEVGPLPRGVRVVQTTIPAELDEFPLVLEAGADAQASAIRRIVQVKARAILGGQTLELPTQRFALKVVRGGQVP